MKFRLRALEQRDLPSMLHWENDQSAWEYSDNIAPLSERQAADYIATYDADPFRAGQLRLVLTDDDDYTLGLLDLYAVSALHAHACVGVYIDPDCRRRGLAKEGLRLLCDYAFGTLGLRTLAAFVLPDNNASVRLFTALRFTRSGSLPGWRRTGMHFSDVDIYILSSPEANQTCL